MKRKGISILIALTLCLTATACSSNTSTNNSTEVNESSKIDIKSLDNETVGEANTIIKLGSDMSVEGEGASINNNNINITKAGTYSISGDMEDGQIVVNASSEDKVYIILNGVNITSKSSAPLYVKSAKKCVLALEKGTENTFTDGESYVLYDEANNEPNASIFSKDDLTIIGEGKLIVNGNYNNGIASKDDLKIQSGEIVVNAKNNGIKGKDCINISSGNLTIKSEGDGLKADNTTDATKGYIYIENGTINITSGEDGIQAETELLIADGDITISSGGGSANSSSKREELSIKDKMKGEKFDPNAYENIDPKAVKPQEPQTNTTNETEEESTSRKAIKATSNITIDGGNIKIDSSDDSIHSNGDLTINEGTFDLSSGDDGIHADSTVTINNGIINVKKSYEGIEGQVININNGDIHVTSSDDGINAAGGNDSSSVNGRPGQNEFESSGSGEININGGNIFVDASGDGLDANGSINMTDGVVIVNGPENNGNGALDYDGKCEVSGGTLIAAGSLGMVQTPSDSSKQNTLNISLTSQEANTLVNVKSESGEEIVTFAPSKSYQSVVICSPNIKSNEKYLVSVGGSSTGKQVDGLYSDGKYSGGANVGDIEVTSVINNITQEGATQGGGMGGGRGGNKGGRPEGDMNGENLTPPGKEMKNPNDAETSATPKNENNSQL